MTKKQYLRLLFIILGIELILCLGYGLVGDLLPDLGSTKNMLMWLSIVNGALSLVGIVGIVPAMCDLRDDPVRPYVNE